MSRAIHQGCNDKREAEIVLKAVMEERARVSLLLQQLCGAVSLCTRGGTMGFCWLVPSLSSLESGRQQQGPFLSR